MSSSEYFDESLEEGVEQSDLDLYCIINRSRIIVNVETVVKIVNVYVQLMSIIHKSTTNVNELQIESKQTIIKALSRK